MLDFGWQEKTNFCTFQFSDKSCSDISEHTQSPNSESKVSTPWFFFAFFPLVNNLQVFSCPHCFIKHTSWKVTVCWHQKAGPTVNPASPLVHQVNPFNRRVLPVDTWGSECPRQPQKGGHLTSPWHLQNKKLRKHKKEKKNRRIGLKVWIINIQPHETMVETVVPTPLYLGALTQSDKQIQRTKFKCISSSQPAHSHFKLSEIAISCQFSLFISHSLIPKSTFNMFLCLATMLSTEDRSPDSSQRQLWIIPVYLHYISYMYSHMHTYINVNTFIKIWDRAEIKSLISNKQFPIAISWSLASEYSTV